jgi:DNA polymerase-3 subunit beta
VKININRRQLLDLLSVASATTGKDVLSNVKISAGPDCLAIDSTDGEIGSVLSSDCECIAPGKCLINPGRVASILGPSTAETVTIEANGQAVTVTAGKASFELPAVDPGTFPAVKTIEGEAIEIPAAALLSAIRRTIFAVDLTSTRYQLGGVLLEPSIEEGETMHLVATDGRRLSTVAVDVAGGKIAGGPIVAHRGLQAILKTFGGASTVTIKTDGASLQVASETATLVCRLVEGRFPNWRGVVPSGNFAHTIPIPADRLKAALSQASVTTLDESRGVELAFRPPKENEAKGTLKISSKGQDRGKSEIEFEVDTAAEIATTIDWRFALDFVKEIPGDEVIEFRINDKTKPIVLAWGTWTYVVMPMSKE